MSWTDERVELLKKMWTEGQSASQIAKELGGVTRNAVIGKVHRLGLSNRVEGGASAAAAAPAAAPAPKPAAPEPTPAPAAAAPAARPEPEVEVEPVRPAAAATPRPTPAPAAAPSAPTAAPAPALRKPGIVPAGQPLPPQPSLNEISPETLASVREVEKRSRKISLMELTERTCKWPIGDPATDNFYFCGLPAQAGKPYCEAHVSVAFQPMSARRDRRR
ncbi:GcrA cell cycle regulator [Rhodobacter aestuarii]|uniref:GcrA cell cycle regulator n=1 Tax=Rhodobacter aestuarii TaxID=453582 RepID=A0A1N7K8X5_9RHOB|nr:GcrA family cell cycle regulator [Rhodobacter aestuarii]PTV95808.1 GcrA cell cycle regulator [Rhodobacter aestuarii]SIS58000.1 GcrA cell cycle regulator [Rhodobacter aestuarii]